MAPEAPCTPYVDSDTVNAQRFQVEYHVKVHEESAGKHSIQQVKLCFVQLFAVILTAVLTSLKQALHLMWSMCHAYM